MNKSLQDDYTAALLKHAESENREDNFPYWKFLEKRVEQLLVEAIEERASYEAERERLLRMVFMCEVCGGCGVIAPDIYCPECDGRNVAAEKKELASSLNIGG
jgi:rubrerythrin